MLKVDRKKGIYEMGENLIDVVSDISLAVFELTYQVSSARGNQNYNDALEEMLNTIRHAVESAYEEEQNGTFG